MSAEETVATAGQEYYCRLTNAGAALEAAAHADAKPVRLTHVAVGDGNGEVPVPSATATALVHEVYRREIDGKERDKEDPNIAWLHVVIPANVGGFWIREFGIYAAPLEEDGEPVLYAVGNHAPYYKLQATQGQATTHELSIPIILSGTAEVEIAVKDAGYASQLEFENLEEKVESERKRLWENEGAGPKLLTSILPDLSSALPDDVLKSTMLGPDLYQDEDQKLALVPRFAVCDTAGATAQKVVTLPHMQVRPGSLLYLKFAHVNTATDLTLAVNGGSAKPILWQGVCPEVGDLAKGQVYQLIHTGDDWQILAGMARWSICQTVWWEDTLARPGLIPLNGCTVPNFSVKWPQAYAYLQTAHGQARCFESLAEREAAHTAIWHTLASGQTVGWEGFGGLCKFFYDAETDTLYVSDVRGLARMMAGDGIVAPSMAGVLGDRERPVTGSFGSAAARTLDNSRVYPPTGALISDGDASSVAPGKEDRRVYVTGIDSSRAVPTGATTAPRSWGALASVYLGQPAHAEG